MKKKQTAQLEKKLAAYSLAGAAALAGTGIAKADIVYVPDVNVTVNQPGSYTFPGAGDITLNADFNIVANEVSVNAGTGAAVLLTGPAMSTNNVAALALGAFIDPTDPTNWSQSGKLVSSFSDTGVWPNAGGTAYMGFYFGTPGSPQAGWAQIATVANDTTSSFELLSYAYETDPNTKIQAGQTTVPEPSALPLLILGGVGLIALRRRRAANA